MKGVLLKGLIKTELAMNIFLKLWVVIKIISDKYEIKWKINNKTLTFEYNINNI